MKGVGVGRQLFGTDVTISFEPVEGGWTQARIPAVPSVITAAATRDAAREMATEHERVHLDVLTVRALDRDSGREL